jgi:hypothetical protein
MPPKSIRSLLIRSLLGASLGLTLASAPARGQDPNLENKGTPETVLGYVRDAACLMRHPDVVKPTNDCALMCIKEGAAIVIATKKGELYTPIGPEIPDASQREKLMPYVAKYVRAKGRVFERGGMKAIAIDTIEVVPDDAKDSAQAGHD